MAIYFANKLCKNGGIAIYVSQKRSIPKYFERIKELKDRGYELTNLRTKSDMNELLRLQKLIFRYYGEESIYSDISKMGILPHYSSLPSGLRMSVEYAFRKGKIYTVICTSTLAQGINIPIKYMILTSLNMAQNSLTVRNFQNLIGRTARPGVYTEGNIIISDSKIYDERKGKRGKFLWRDTEYMFDPNREEACSSAILSIVQNIDLTYKFSVDGSMVTEYICNNISKNWTASDLFADEKEYEEKYKKDIISKLNSILQNYRNSVDSIENEILYVWRLEDGENTKSINMISQKICTNSLAYYLANDEEKKRLSKLFEAMATDIYSNIDRTNRYAFSMLSPPNIVLILDWISSCRLNNQKKTEDELIEQITGLYQSIYTGTDISFSICRNWIKGKSYFEISQTTSLDLFKIEKICNYNLLYQFCFLVGNVIDCLEESVNTEMFMLLQKKIKYGVDSVTAISICEKVFNDRMLAKDITNILDDKHISNDEIIGFIKMKKEKVSDYLKDYPIFFQDKIKYLR